jgi:toxic protein SymE
MTKAHSKLKSTACKDSTPCTTKRFYTIGYTPNLGRPNPTPQLTIKDKWLNHLGFTTGQPVVISIEQDRLIIRLAR